MIRLLLSIACGVFLTVAFLGLAIVFKSDFAACVLLWPGCLVEALFGTHNLHDPVRFFLVGFAGILLTIPFYALIAYVILGKVLPKLSR